MHYFLDILIVYLFINTTRYKITKENSRKDRREKGEGKNVRKRGKRKKRH